MKRKLLGLGNLNPQSLWPLPLGRATALKSSTTLHETCSSGTSLNLQKHKRDDLHLNPNTETLCCLLLCIPEWLANEFPRMLCLCFCPPSHRRCLWIQSTHFRFILHGDLIPRSSISVTKFLIYCDIFLPSMTATFTGPLSINWDLRGCNLLLLK